MAFCSLPTTAASVDDDLSKLTSSSLSISLTKEISKCGDSNIVFPKERHGLYSNTLSDVGMSTQPPKDEKEVGVPGFPDFPSFWFGEEGWVVWKRTNRREKNSDEKKTLQACRMQELRLTRRQPVNLAGMTTRHKRRERKQSWKKPKAKIQQRTTKQTERRRKVLQKLKHRRQMAKLNRGLASLSCS